ncbi:hypothetical protein CHLRE_17g747597v5 [Chlamydomonas reinhardtii]|uniref:Uncharacterized protein n=1 Tax=Chlamydomonas reinhardtii TaxID=3055 RepID=A0A2K3CS55_CHLRE|nr:uncharacterized protein CHLRE_17g747597v5 [Chlamydomonas reinhardtii]PNW71123.1 hypothetical protein CHLRE_17g747597v5 [Chlamydomonas reinhardtii]
MASAPTLEVVGLGQVPTPSPRAAMLNPASRLESSAWRVQLLGQANDFNHSSLPSSSAQASLLLLLPLRQLAVPCSTGPTPTALSAATHRAHPAVPRLHLTPSPGSNASSPATHSSGQVGISSQADGPLPSGGPIATSTCGGSDSSSADSSSRASSWQRLDDAIFVSSSSAVQPKRQSGTGDWASGRSVVGDVTGAGSLVAPEAVPNGRAMPRRLAPSQNDGAPPALQPPPQLLLSPQRRQPPPQPVVAMEVLAAAERQAVAAFPALNMNSPGRPRRQSIGVPQHQPQQPTQQQGDRTPRLGPTRSQPHISIIPREAPPLLQLLCVGGHHDQPQQLQAHPQQPPVKMQPQRKADPWTSSAATATAPAASAAVGGFGSCCSRPCLLPTASKGRPRAASFDTPRTKGAGCSAASCCGGSNTSCGGNGDTAVAAAGLPALLRLAAVGTSFSCSGAVCGGAGGNASASSEARPAQVLQQLKLPSLGTVAAATAAGGGGGNGGGESKVAAVATPGCEWAAAMPSCRPTNAGVGHVAASSIGGGAPARGWTSARVADPVMVGPVAAAPSARKWEAPAVGVQ